jgi:chromosome segregation ATPase
MVEVLVAIVGIVAGNLSALMFFPQMRRTKVLENASKECEEWKKLYSTLKDELKTEKEEHVAEIKRKDEKIDSLYAAISKHRDDKSDLCQRVAELEVENTKLKILKCEIAGCLKRTPPTGY